MDHLFISYGHADATGFARRLKGDLEAARSLSPDLQRLRSGDPSESVQALAALVVRRAGRAGRAG
jgi:hypothetical protein